MNNPNTTIKTFSNTPHNEGGGNLYVVTRAYGDDEQTGERMRVRYESLAYGTPGYVRLGAMNEGQAKRYIARLEDDRVGHGAPVDQRQIGIYQSTDQEALGGMLGLAVYGRSTTMGGAIAMQSGINSAHMQTFNVTHRTRNAAEFTSGRLRTLGTVLGYAAVLDIESRGFTEVSRRIEEVTMEEFRAETERLGVWGDLEKREVEPYFAVEVEDPLGMIRTEFAISTAILRDAYEQTYPWLTNAA